ncbi:tyrosine-type recombinase/integrase [Neisseria iguanae]|uniref:tyrosine-type recombinase/integrase n=1 Tax=Neisseria iguanae TaxID=90242 RepID=UPI001FE3BE56|nr:site-specific integrase [Neisseria iguanae]
MRDKPKHEAWRVSNLGEKPKRIWDEAAVRWIQEKSQKKSIDGDIAKIRALTQLQGVYLHHIDRDLIQAIVGKLRCKDSTKNRYLALIRSILRAAVNKWEWLDKAPHIEQYRESESRIRWLKPEEAQRLIDAAKPRYFADLIIFSLNTGLRQTNVLGLKWNQVDLERRICWYHPDEMKAGKALGVVLNEAAVSVLERQIGKHQTFVFVNKRGNPITEIDSRYWKYSLEQAGIEDFTWHDLRHTWASWLVQRGVPLRVLQEMGGWKTLAMVRFRGMHTSRRSIYTNTLMFCMILSGTWTQKMRYLAQIRHKKKRQLKKLSCLTRI